jgi:ABC-type uncharacterized transport system permease subunit
MPHLDKSLMMLGALCYLGAIILLVARSVRAGRLVLGGVLIPLILGVFLQGWGLYLRGMQVGGCPVGNKFEVLQYISWTVVGITLLLGRTFSSTLPGSLAAALGSVLSAITFMFPAWDATRISNVLGPNPWLETHAALAVTSYGVFAALAVSCGMHLFQYRSLKSRRPRGPAGLLPSLQQLDRINFRLLSVATGLLTIAIAIGGMFWAGSPDAVGGAKLAAALALWIAASTVIGLRLAHLAAGPRLSYFGILLFVAAILSVWPVNLRGITKDNIPPRNQHTHE